MANGVYIGMSSAVASQRRLEIVANNIANANTVGYRQQRSVFQDFLVDTLDGSESTKGGTQITETVIDSQNGAMERTGNPLDVALEGEGYFAVRGPGGVMVTRGGNFRTQADGKLVDASGMEVLGGSPEAGFTPIFARPEEGPVSVAADGSVEQAGTTIAKIAVVTVDGSLRPTGGSHLAPQPGTLRGVPQPTVASGFLESSNVNPVRGMVELMEISQDYQSSQKLMSEFRRMDRAILGINR